MKFNHFSGKDVVAVKWCS